MPSEASSADKRSGAGVCLRQRYALHTVEHKGDTLRPHTGASCQSSVLTGLYFHQKGNSGDSKTWESRTVVTVNKARDVFRQNTVLDVIDRRKIKSVLFS